MKVIGAGLPRTATTTQMAAMEMVGFAPCYHMRDVLGDLENQLPHWEAVVDGNPDWDAVFGDAQSTCDWPSARWYADLIEYYPEAKVILTVRSAEAWVKRMRETVWGLFHADSPLHYLSTARTTVDPLWRRYISLMTRINWDEQTGAMAGDTFSDEGLAAIMTRWNDEVKSTVPAERLLVWDPKEGWDPFCEFLEVDVPETPLPHLNETVSFNEGVIGGAIAAVNEWWEQRERPETGLHGAQLKEPA
jgi:hypothetical protein